MRIIENHCVGCETCTLGLGCSQLNVLVIYCDICGDSDAKYHIDDLDYCEECANQYLDDLFHDSFTVKEKADIIDVSYEENE